MAYPTYRLNRPPVSISVNSTLQDALSCISELALGYLNYLHDQIKQGSLPPRFALIGQIRSKGFREANTSGTSLQTIVRPIAERLNDELTSPFEESENVAGAELPLASVLEPTHQDGCLWLRFSPGTTDLPMHSHEASDRFIMVVEGAGEFHVCDQSVGDFSGKGINSTALKPGDVIIFPRGTVHTFSTSDDKLLLLSYHAPFVPLISTDQYLVTENVVYPGKRLMPPSIEMGCDIGWARVA